MLMIEPPSAAAIRVPIVADNRKGPLRLVPKTLSYNASVTWSTLGYRGDMPALFTKRSTVPNSA
jgi:hypothetical protein